MSTVSWLCKRLLCSMIVLGALGLAAAPAAHARAGDITPGRLSCSRGGSAASMNYSELPTLETRWRHETADYNVHLWQLNNKTQKYQYAKSTGWVRASSGQYARVTLSAIPTRNPVPDGYVWAYSVEAKMSPGTSSQHYLNQWVGACDFRWR